jgi:hypothetical protein
MTENNNVIKATRYCNFILVPYESDPIPAIQTAMRKPDWFQAIIISAVQLERFGYFMVKEHFRKLKLKDNKGKVVNVDKEDVLLRFIDRLYLPEFGVFLLGIKKINFADYQSIILINDQRNQLMHHREKSNPIGKEVVEKYEHLVNEAIRILREKLDAEKKQLP